MAVNRTTSLFLAVFIVVFHFGDSYAQNESQVITVENANRLEVKDIIEGSRFDQLFIYDRLLIHEFQLGGFTTVIYIFDIEYPDFFQQHLPELQGQLGSVVQTANRLRLVTYDGQHLSVWETEQSQQPIFQRIIENRRVVSDLSQDGKYLAYTSALDTEDNVFVNIDEAQFIYITLSMGF